MPRRNIDLKTISKAVKKETASITLGGQVPTGMKRWVTFVLCDSMSAVKRMSSFGLRLASVATAYPTIALVVATGNRKLAVDCSGTQVSRSGLLRPVMFPPAGPDPDTPLFSIASGKYLGVVASRTTVNLFVQYYDE